jgi:Flp pilus assembly pilin Flp
MRDLLSTVQMHARVLGLTLLGTNLRREEGQGLAEYALILFFIAVVAVAALTFLGTAISSLLSAVGNKL